MTRSSYLVHQGLRWEEKEILVASNKCGLNIEPVSLSHSLWSRPVPNSGPALAETSCFVLRTPSFFHSLQISQWCAAQRVGTLNSAANLALFGQKIATYTWAIERGLSVLPLWLGLTLSAVKEAVEHFQYPVVVKQNIGGFGKLVRIVRTPEQLVYDAEVVFNYAPASHCCLLIQPFLELKQDIRVTILNKKPLAVIQRISKDGNFRHNIAEGAEAKKIVPTLAVGQLIERICEELPLGFYGVDVFEERNGTVFLNEVNAVPLFHASSEASGVNIAAEFVHSIVQDIR